MGFKHEVTLGQIALEAVDGPFGSNLPASAYVSEGIPVIRGSNLSLGQEQFKDSEFVYISEATFKKLKRSECIAGDILFTKKGTLGQTGIIPQKHRYSRFLLSSNQMRLRVNEEKAIPEYVYYFVSSANSIEKIKRESESTGVPKINLEYLKNFRIYLPPLESQSKIVNVLQSLDNKIKLNRQTNQILEHMAQALFKSWFVDFDPVIDNALAAGNKLPDELAARVAVRQRSHKLPNYKPLPADIQKLFPNEFEHTDDPAIGIEGWIPKGWKVSTTGDEFEVKGGSTPSTNNPEFWDGGDICWTSPKDLSGNESKILLDTSRKITEAGLKKITSGLLPVNTVLMSSRAPVGYLAFAKIPVAINQGYIALLCEKTLSPEYTVQFLDSIMDEIKGISGGTTFAEISKKTFRSIKLIVPSKPAIDAFTSVTKANYDKITENIKQTNSLAETRDYLLPKLITGEVILEGICHE
ncbi:restriction endonuclease subunit S [Catenovulum agarivorans]|uniref:restriction endonuclease subunit S n=1 Tax=Catenovulum agarivorans TaxID=1172192 RepID=UPI00031AA64F|nr:restriction endonuclease subunit S [Catenovulum agarivorans]